MGMGHTMVSRTSLVLWIICLAMALVGFDTLVHAQDLEIAAIFWCENESQDGAIGDEEKAALQHCQEDRQLILFNCTSCHTFVPIVLSQKTRDEWDATLTVHRPRVTSLTEEQWGRLLDYLATHFNPETPLPELPPELLGGTNQAF